MRGQPTPGPAIDGVTAIAFSVPSNPTDPQRGEHGPAPTVSGDGDPFSEAAS